MKIKRKIALLLGVVLFAAPLLNNQIQKVDADGYTYNAGDSLTGNNLILNSYFEYSSSVNKIPDWRIFTTNNVSNGIGEEKSIDTTVTSGLRKILGTTNKIEVHNVRSGNGNFISYLDQSNNTNGFLSLAQTFTNLDTDLVYTLNIDLRGTAGTTFALLAYNGDAVAGTGALAETKTTVAHATD